MLIVALFVTLAVLVVVAMAIISARQGVSGTGPVSRYRERRRHRPAAHFRLERVSQHRYVLFNDGGAPAFDIRPEMGELTVSEGESHLRELGPGQSTQYVFIQPMHGHVSDLVVHWRARPRDKSVRTTPLPLDIEVAPEDQEA